MTPRALVLSVAFASLAALGVACAPAQQPPAVSAAEITSGPVTPETPSAKQATVPDEAAATSAGIPSGQLVCRTKSATGTSELHLEWQGSSAKGTLHQMAPSGNVTDTSVRAERLNGMIVADDVHETDLVMHAAIVTERSGKKYMRLGDEKQTWLACE